MSPFHENKNEANECIEFLWGWSLSVSELIYCNSGNLYGYIGFFRGSIALSDVIQTMNNHDMMCFVHGDCILRIESFECNCH